MARVSCVDGPHVQRVPSWGKHPSKPVLLVVSPALRGGGDARRTDSQGNMGLVSRSPHLTVPVCCRGPCRFASARSYTLGAVGVGGRVAQVAWGPSFHSLWVWGPDLSGSVAGLGFGDPGCAPSGLRLFGGAHLPVAVIAKGAWDWYRDHTDWRFQPADRARFALRPPTCTRARERRPTGRGLRSASPESSDSPSARPGYSSQMWMGQESWRRLVSQSASS